MSPFEQVLKAAVPALGERARALCEQHWQLVKAWNARTNLTAITSDVEAAHKHYADSLAGLAYLPPGPIVDLGSGAGYPGIPLAIAEPARPVTLVEPRQKRVSFLEAAVARLRLVNVRVVCGSSHDTPPQEFAAAVTRATFSDPKDLLAGLAWAPMLIAWRTDATGQMSAEVHRYMVDGQPRVLEIVRRS